MSSRIFSAIVEERIERLRLAFLSSKSVYWSEEKKKLIHANEYGVFRERAVIELLELFTPTSFGIATGFIVTASGEVSTQCDIVVYNQAATPKIITDSHQLFFPVESVVAVGEVKSDIQSVGSLNKHLKKLAAIKSLRHKCRNDDPIRKYGGEPFRPKLNPLDHMFTFLICKRLGFKPDSEAISYSEQVVQCDRHNLVISIDQGMFCYETLDGPPNYYYPNTGKTSAPDVWREGDQSPIPIQFMLFLPSFFNAMNAATLLEPDFVPYLTDNVYKSL